MSEAEKKGVGVKVTPTIPQDIYKKLEADAEINGMKAATRIGQIVSLFYNGKLALVDSVGVQNVVISMPNTPPTPPVDTTPSTSSPNYEVDTTQVDSNKGDSKNKDKENDLNRALEGADENFEVPDL